MRWLLTIQFPLIAISEDLWSLWLPLLLPWIPILIWLKPRLDILTFNDLEDRRRSLFLFISWGLIGSMLFVSQSYFTTATGKLSNLTSIDEIKSLEKFRYFRIENLSVDKHRGGSYTDFRVSGRHHENLKIDIYYAYPIRSNPSNQLETTPKIWYGVKFQNQINNRLAQEEKEKLIIRFHKKCARLIKHFDFNEFDYLEKNPKSSIRANYYRAIEKSIGQSADSSFIVLEPIQSKFEDRNGDKFMWIFRAFGIGISIIILLLLWPGYSEEEYQKFKSGKKSKNDDFIQVLKFLIPKDHHYVTSIILNINLLVFIIMVFSGVDPLSPNSVELLEWGANRRDETMSGEWWRLFTSMFIHAGIMHLVLNIFSLLIASFFMEPLFGRKDFAFLYIAAGISGSIASILWYPNTISIGASGAIFGVFGALLGLLSTDAYPKESKKLILWLSGLFVGINLLMGLTGGIDNAAHIGGLVSGAGIGVLLYNNQKSKKV
ncbi:MAG: rhomboid family intramembrane serine protease [Flavobacteriales bacterium]|nr:MAG: rhomboid family intramembrane serine protease [Flavobacteriales bacterium]